MPATRSKNLRDKRSDESTFYPQKSTLKNLHAYWPTLQGHGGTTKPITIHPEKYPKAIIPAISNTVIPEPREPPSTYRDFPAELWGIVGQHLSSPKDLAALCLANRSAKRGTLTHLYRRPLITNNERELHVVEGLCSPRNEGLKYIRHLTVAPTAEKVRPPGAKRFSKSRAKRLEHDVLIKILAAVPLMPLLQSIALCNNYYDDTNLTNHGLDPYKQSYVREIIPYGFFEHGCCFGHNSDTWNPQYWIWGKNENYECEEAEQKALFKSKLGFCWLEGVKDNHTLAWRICD